MPWRNGGKLLDSDTALSVCIVTANSTVHDFLDVQSHDIAGFEATEGAYFHIVFASFLDGAEGVIGVIAVHQEVIADNRIGSVLVKGRTVHGSDGDALDGSCPEEIAIGFACIVGSSCIPNDTQKENDPEGEAVDETIAAEGGETTPDAPEPAEKEPQITVTLNAMGGECPKETVKVNAGSVYGVLPAPTKAGQSFQGWFLEAEGGEPVNEITVVLAEEDHTLYAHWTAKTEFLLTFEPNGGRISPYYPSAAGRHSQHQCGNQEK